MFETDLCIIMVIQKLEFMQASMLCCVLRTEPTEGAQALVIFLAEFIKWCCTFAGF